MCCCGDNTPPPDNFPKGIETEYKTYKNWAIDSAFGIRKILYAYPKTKEDIRDIVNWAHKAGYRVRPIGIHHNWSPLTEKVHADPGYIADPEAKNVKPADIPKTVLVDNTKYFNDGFSAHKENKTATCQPGITLGDFLGKLEKVGLGLPHTPAPYDITMGGVLTINGHGTAILSAEDKKAGKPDNYGTVSNRLVSMTIVAYDKEKDAYDFRTIDKSDKELFPAVQVGLGRIFFVEFTMQCIPNYMLRCRSTFLINWKELFPEPKKDDNGEYIVPGDDAEVGNRFPRKSYSHYVDKFGNAEVIWFPYNNGPEMKDGKLTGNGPWLKVWNRVDAKGPGVDYSKRVDKACSYTFTDHIPNSITYGVKAALGYKQDVDEYGIFDKQKKDVTDTVSRDPFACCCGMIRNWFGGKRPEFDNQDDEDLYGRSHRADTDFFQSVIDDAMAGIKGKWGKVVAVPEFGRTLGAYTHYALQNKFVWDLWGPSKNTLLYVRTTTARVTANGYVVIMKRRQLQLGVWLFIDLYKRLEDKYASKGMYPANMPVEIRVTGLDHTSDATNCTTPYLSGCTPEGVPEEILNDDPVLLWLDNLSFPETQDAPIEQAASQFYAEMEEELVKMYSKYNMPVRPEWSKGWAYSAEDGAYTSQWFFNHTRKNLPSWNKAIGIFDELDPKHIYGNDTWDTFMVKVDGEGAPADLEKATAQENALKKIHEQVQSRKKQVAANLNVERVAAPNVKDSDVEGVNPAKVSTTAPPASSASPAAVAEEKNEPSAEAATAEEAQQE